MENQELEKNIIAIAEYEDGEFFSLAAIDDDGHITDEVYFCRKQGQILIQKLTILIGEDNATS
jgi:hypothetical protein